MSAEAWAGSGRAVATTLPGRRRTDLALAIGVFAAVLGAILPLLRVIDAGAWLAGALFVAAAVLATGFAARAYRLPGVAVALLEAVTWLVLLTFLFGRSSALLWLIPTPETFGLVPVLVSGAVDEIMLGAAPLTAGVPLSFLLIAAIGLVAIAIDHVVVTARMPLLAAVGLIAVSLIPSIAVPGDVDLFAFVLLAATILFLLRVDTRARQRPRIAAARAAGEPAVRTSGATATAIGIGAIAVIVAVVAAPLLPAPVARVGSGGLGTGSTIDPTLQLGDDLRQPRETQVLTVRSSASSPPYLRAVTLSRFDGAVWQPDEGRPLPVGEDGALPEPEATDPDIALTAVRTTVEVDDLDSPWLPVPYPATSVSGLDGRWGLLPQNRTVISRDASTQGQSYEVATAVPRPTLEQIRGREAGGDVPEETLALPDALPPVIAETAAELTANAQDDYDALTTLQAWFRSPQFSYSLDAPVDDGFDGSGADAVAEFLEQRTGYCVHFASAFALMARTLGMPSRIVVGYLPGTNTNTATEGETVYAVSSGQLHAWPEVHFPGVGWVPFEPTNSLGVPTSFSSAVTPGAGTPADRGPEESAQPSAAPTATPTTGPQLPDEAATGGTGAAQSTANPWPGIAIGAAVIVALLLPALLRTLRRRRLGAAAAAGDAASAWLALQQAALDLGIAVPGSESPRAFAERLSRAHGAPHSAVRLLAAEIERASYAGGSGMSELGPEMARALDEVTDGLRAAAPRARRLAARFAPRSLLVRPGSAYAHAPEPAPA